MKILLILAALLLPVAATAADLPPVTAPDGIAIHATSAGEGPVVVLVHGWSCDATYWQDQVGDLALDHHVVTIDLAGHGASDAGRDVSTMEAFGADVAAVLEAWDLRDAILVGHSMGGAVITEAALAAPDRVRGLIGVDNFQKVDMKLSEQQIAGFVGTFESNFTAFVPQWVGSMFPAHADSALKATIAADMASAPQEVAISAMEELLAWYGGRAQERLAALQVPLMCINADMQPTDEEAMKAVVPGYQARYLANTGHFLFRESPVAFNSLLRTTLAAFE